MRTLILPIKISPNEKGPFYFRVTSSVNKPNIIINILNTKSIYRRLVSNEDFCVEVFEKGIASIHSHNPFIRNKHIMNPSTSSRVKKSIVVNPYEKVSTKGKYENTETYSVKKSKRTSNDCVDRKVEYASTPSPKKKSKSDDNCIDSKVEYASTPNPRESKNGSSRVVVVTNSSIIHSDKKTKPPRSKDSNSASKQSTIDGSPNIHRRLEFENRTPFQASRKAAAISTETSSQASSHSSRFMSEPKQLKISTKSSNEQSKDQRLELSHIEWTDCEQLRNEISKYTKNNTMLLTQENIVEYLLNESTTTSIKSAFYMLIGEKGVEARNVFYPIPIQRAKLIDSFLVMIYNVKSMMVDEKSQAYR